MKNYRLSRSWYLLRKETITKADIITGRNYHETDICKYCKLSRKLISSNHQDITYTDIRSLTVIITKLILLYHKLSRKLITPEKKTTSRQKWQEAVRFVLLRSEVIIHGQSNPQHRSPSVKIINPLEKLPSGSRVIFHAETFTNLRKVFHQIHQIQEIQNSGLIWWSRIRYQNQPTLVYPGKKFFQLTVQQRSRNLKLLQVCRIIKLVHHDIFSFHKNRHEAFTPSAFDLYENYGNG